MNDDRVPEWVHMAEVPPPVDEEPWTFLEESRERSRNVVLVCIAALVFIVLYAVVTGSKS